MSAVKVNRTVYFSQRKGRHFFTAKAAARAEANARVCRFFPTEKGSDEYSKEGFQIVSDPGWHFTEEPRLVAVRDRLISRYLKELRS